MNTQYTKEITEEMHQFIKKKAHQPEPLTESEIEKCFLTVKNMIKQGADFNERMNFEAHSPIEYLVNLDQANGYRLFKKFLTLPNIKIKDPIALFKKVSEISTRFSHKKNSKDKKSRHFEQLEQFYDIQNVLDLIKKTGIEINKLYPFEGSTIIHEIIRCRDANILKWLIKNGADVNIELGGENGNNTTSPLHLAIEYDEFSLVKILLKAGADIDYCNINGHRFEEINIHPDIKNYLIHQKILSEKNKLKKINSLENLTPRLRKKKIL